MTTLPRTLLRVALLDRPLQLAPPESWQRLPAAYVPSLKAAQDLLDSSQVLAFAAFFSSPAGLAASDVWPHLGFASLLVARKTFRHESTEGRLDWYTTRREISSRAGFSNPRAENKST